MSLAPGAVGLLAPASVAAPTPAVGSPPNLLDPQGPAGADIAVLWWVLLGLGMAVFVAVCLLLFLASVRQRTLAVGEDALTGEGFAGGSNLLVAIGGIAFPAVVVVGLMVATVVAAERVATVGGPSEPLVIDVVGHQFWWDVTYPDHGIRTANEVHLPVGQPVQFRMSSADVIHSFWIPQLGGKVDMSPGHRNTLRLLAEQPGVYRGICTEYCGLQHARMHFVVVAHEPEAFAQWLEERGETPEEPEEEGAVAGREVFIGAGCAECHTIDGVSPYNHDYPDLTHFAERRSIAAGALPNNRGALGGWILDPQGLKPGNRMPPANLTGPELQDLLDYLETLR